MSLNYTEIFKNNPPDTIDKLNDCKIGIAGCGGLGSNIAMLLVRAGVTQLVIVDFDNVELPNLNRQFYFLKDIGKPKVDAIKENLLQINPEISVEAINKKLSVYDFYETFKDCDIIVEAFDSVQAKTMVIQLFQDEKFDKKFLVGGSGLAGNKTVNNIKTRRLANNIYVCGDFLTESNETTGLLSSRVMVTAAHQANMVIRIISDNLNP